MYKKKYQKYKSKYLQLKQVADNISDINQNEQKGGLRNVGLYNWKGKTLKSTKTPDGKYVSFYEMSPLELQDTDITKAVKPDRTKVLVIDTIKAFDEFTGKYTNLGIENTLYVKWDKVAKDFMGFYLVRTDDLKLARHSHAMSRGKRFISWWGYEYDFINVMVFYK